MTAPNSTHEPIAVIGMSCRFPGADSIEEFWRLLVDGVDAVDEVPPDRWNIDDFYDPNPAAPGKMSTRSGGFLQQVDQFDAQFFGITPREASRLDPQHRLLLELSWEALESAGLAPDRLAGSDTGIFAGLTTNDYSFLQVPDLEGFNGHAGMGSGHCIATGRLSYFYDFHGPNAAVDTACSSSLVAVHMACQSLRAGECNAALAGGVNVMAAPHMTVFLSEWGVLAGDGRCKTFDSSADGFGRSEGCGFVVLKRLSDAEADGDNVLAVIRGTAINQDGRGTRFSASNASAQEAVVRKALADARLDASKITFVETHGTGTPIGDPIEVEALTAVVGRERADGARCALGSVKANVGHLEAAAGVAGLIKAVLCLQNDLIPGQLHIKQLNPNIVLDGTALFIPTANTEWPRQSEPRRAGVSSFGLSGTNSHVIVEEAPALRPASSPEGPQLLTISGRTTGALKESAEAHRRYLLSPGGPPAGDVCYTAALRRAHHPYRAAVVGSTREELAERLGALNDKDFNRPAAPTGVPEKVAMVFSGQGSQWTGMGLDLLETEPVFREQVQRCDDLLSPYTGWSLIEELKRPAGNSRLGETEVAQPAIFAVQAGLLALYESWGVRPDAVVGHSSGEVAAAYAAGIFSLDQAMKIVYHRSRLMQKATGLGRMAATGLRPDQAAEAIAGYEGRLSVAAINGPSVTVIAGDPESLAEVVASLKAREVFVRDLGVNYAFHTHQMEPFLDELVTSLADLKTRPGTVRFVSTVTGRSMDSDELAAPHWADNIRRPVDFVGAMDSLLDSDFQVFLEVGPKPVLATPVSQCMKARGWDGSVIASLREGQDAKTSMLKSLGGLFCAGAAVEWARVFSAGGRNVDLPHYPWQRRRHWLTNVPTFQEPAPAPQAPPRPAGSNGHSNAEEGREIIASFYDRVSDTAASGEAFRRLTFAPFPEVVPGFSWIRSFYGLEHNERYAEMTRKAHEQMRSVLFRGLDLQSLNSVLDFGCGYGTDLINLAQAHNHLYCDGYTLSQRQAELGNEEARKKGIQDRVAIYCRNSAEDEFPRQYDLVFGFEVAHYIQDKHKLFSHIDRHLNDGGFVVLADFVAKTVSEIRHDATNSYFSTLDQWCDLLAEYKLRVSDCVDVSQEMANFLHDPDADANLARLVGQVGNAGDLREHFTSYDGLGKLFRKKLAMYGLMTIQKDRFMSKAEIARINRERLGTPVSYPAALQRLDLAPEPSKADSSLGEAAGWLYEVEWDRTPAPSRAGANGSAAESQWLILADASGVAEASAGILEAAGHSCILVHPGKSFEKESGRRYRVNPSAPEDLKRLATECFPSGRRGIVHLWGMDTAPGSETSPDTLESDHDLACGSLLHVIHAAGEAAQNPARIWVGTRAAQPHALKGAVSVPQASQWGLARTLAGEQPSLWGGLCDLDPEESPEEGARHLVDELLGADAEDQVCYRAGVRYTARLRPAGLPGTGDSEGVNAQVTYLITGGLGGLGLEVARWLVNSGARNLALVHRSHLPDRSLWPETGNGDKVAPRMAAVRDLEKAGAKIGLYQCDVTRSEQVAQTLASIREAMPPIAGVIHTAGVLEDGLLGALDAEGLQRVIRPKVAGAWNLHLATEADPIEFFVMFSSLAAAIGSPGQANYAAANAGMDAVAHLRRSRGLPALSLDWGPWSAGMAAAQDNRGKRVAQRGLRSLPPDRALALLGRLIGSGATQVAVMDIDAARMAAAWPHMAALPILAELFRRPEPAAATAPPGPAAEPAPAGTSSPLDVLLAADPGQRPVVLQEYLREQTARVLQLVVSDVDPRQPLNRMGIDSLMSVELRNHIEADLKVSVQLVTLLEGAALRDLTKDILEQIDARTAEPDPLMQAMKQIEHMSDEEVEALLAQKRQQHAK